MPDKGLIILLAALSLVVFLSGFVPVVFESVNKAVFYKKHPNEYYSGSFLSLHNCYC